MAWTCYSCGIKNTNSADQCVKCGGTVAAPRSFYIQWVFGGAIFFFVVYLAGVLAGGVLVEATVAPESAQILVEVNSNLAGDTKAYPSIEVVEPEKVAGAKAALIARAKAEMSPVVRIMLAWLLPALLFVICGIIVGFVSDGKTVLEAGFGSILGQAGGFAVVEYVIESHLGLLVLGVGVVPGFALAVLGAWLGEIFQDRKERAGGITG
ncbi:MAG TPA: hypothetical protein VM285_09565 [Polyangia bacterium]|nr:hypothetical protein [Polyangia bacterium]